MIFTCVYKNDGHMGRPMWIVTAYYADGTKQDRAAEDMRDALKLIKGKQYE